MRQEDIFMRFLFAPLLLALLVHGTTRVHASTVPTHPTLRAAHEAGTLPKLLPVRRFVANTDFAGGHVLSPDGEHLLWETVVGTDTGLAVGPVPATSPRPEAAKQLATGPLSRPGSAGPTYTWLADSRHVVYLKDPNGNENTTLWVWDTQGSNTPWALPMAARSRSMFVSRGTDGSPRFLFSSNQRDKSTFDLYEADAATRTVKEVARSDGQVLGWLTGSQRQLAGRVRQRGTADGSGTDFQLLQADGSWQTVKSIDGFDAYWVHRIDTDQGQWWATSNEGRDKTVLLSRNLATGDERVLASHPVTDIGPVYLGARGGPLAYMVEPGHPELVALDPTLGQDMAQAATQALAQGDLPEAPVFLRPQSSSESGQRWVLRAVGHFDAAELLLDRRTGQVKRLNAPEYAEAQATLGKVEPFSFKASDGTPIHGYLIKPRGVTGPVPLVVDIHGGPWARDGWSDAAFRPRQMLVNRGYAVLTVNYRGSTGYGKAFMWAGAHEYAGRLQQDIAEAVQWAIDRKVADPKALAVMGGSFGGFSVLMQLAQQPHDYRCGINIVGVANWPRVVDNWPPFWRNRHMFERFYGNANDPKDRAAMLANSPVSHLDRITAPLLVVHGANDVRVLKQDSDDVVAGLKALGRPVEALVFENEGHSIRHWRNRLALWRKVEDHLATCLGGRNNGFDLFELMPR
jgi:dipeptidyl aminopeptidase/acylaminoacyl peptidase